ncbi:G-type lectin S-receptor-like serine/threonine-protein kinase SD2-5 isoform X2 [Quercus robur]|uniref:G-type lectin S-receptor-like serine/threonine-protein kinase SD2-5 isoform X2 n=1 Tax=Quercus robur TaxID=38942 RepID=UPI0021637EC6|nr:G-type lectin S-receptor-like serine/threonine-protein kinase SD2-5 isoform X2 [Quercus robur]
MGWACCTVLLYLVLFPIIVLAESYLTVNSSTTSWTNREPVGDLLKADAVIIFASRSSVDPDYGNACFWGFFCDQTCNSSRFATFFLNDDPRVLWSANPKNPVSIDATLKLNSERGLVLQDADGTIAWSTNISTKSVAALNLTDNCNLMLLDENNATIWQSFDLQYGPFDVLFYGQKLVPGQQLTSEGGMPTRYSYDDLRTITKNFSKELGGGGFGTVFEGTLIDSTKVAVKRLDGFSQIKKSFLAEVETIGNTHHFNLVRLIGFCAEKFQRLLVYEYMSNGSLDRWIFNKNSEMLLDWKLRKKIMIDIARGLTYLHEECRQKIVHMDIKPHNILLDENFNAKVSDFGLSRLVDRDQSQVVTTMRGTPGYMAPEWLSSVITEKVDVYSFGIVLLEILCGRRNFDRSQPEEAMHLVDLFKNKIEGDRLVDLVDKHSEDMQLHGEEVVNMMRVATWCLQNDFTKRPSMSMVVKVFEGVVNVESDLDYFFSNPHLLNPRTGVDNQEVQVVATTPLFPSVLSGPR